MLVSVLGVSHVWGLSVSVGAWFVPCVGVECWCRCLVCPMYVNRLKVSVSETGECPMSEA